MARTPRGVAAAEPSGPIPRYPLGPSALEVHVVIPIQDGVIVPWGGDKAVSRDIIQDVDDIDLEQAKATLFRRQLGSMDLPFDQRTATVRGSVELVEYAMERAHRATVHLIGDQALPAFLQSGWIAGKIGVPKGSPPVRQVNLHRPGE